MRKDRALGVFYCLFCAMLWGIAFVAQDVAADHMAPFTFQCSRSLIGAAALVPVFFLRDAFRRRHGENVRISRPVRRRLWLCGALLGTVLAAASCFQQFGIANNTTSPGKDAFITSFYIVLVPLGSILFGKRVQPHIFGCVAVALGGLWLLCMGGATVSVGDVQVLISALIFTVQILLIDRVAPGLDGVRLSAVQFLVMGVETGVLMFLFETPTWAQFGAAWLPVLYAGIFSCAGAYTMQILGQQRTPPAVASLLMSLEAVFAVLASLVMLHMAPSPREIGGMALMFVAVVCSQIPFRYPAKKASDPNIPENDT